MPLAENFQRAEDQYFRLKGQLAAGRLTPEQYDRAIADLMVQDERGRYWSVGADSGKWYVHDGQTWIEATPPAVAAAPPGTAPGNGSGAAPAVEPVRQRVQAGDAPRYAGFLRRVIALLIDYVLIYALQKALQPLLFGIMGAPRPYYQYSSSYSAFSFEAYANLMPYLLLISVAYFVVFWAALGRTPGKLLLGMKIVTAQGGRLGLGRAIGRYVAMLVSGICFGLGFLWVIVDPRKQGWHDKLAGTQVVRV